MGPRACFWMAGTILLLLGDPVAAGDLEAGEAVQVQIVCFNFETVQVTWNDVGQASGTNLSLFYRYTEEQEFLPCARYLVRRGRTAGCHLPGYDDFVYLELRAGARRVLAMQRWLDAYLELSTPQDLQFLWGPDAVTVLCHTLPYPGLLYEVQHRTSYDAVWQSTVAPVCNATFAGLDLERCHLFRARVKTEEAFFSSDVAPSNWTRVAHWWGAAPQASCLQPLQRLWSPWTRFLLVCSLVSLLAVALLVVGLWKAQRVKRVLMPAVPDPSSSFRGLFEQHHGDFQEWISYTQRLAPWRKAPAGEQEPAAEQPLQVQLSRVDTQLPAAPSPRQEEAPAGSPRPPLPEPQVGSLASLGGFAFVVTDSAYMTL